MHHAYISGWDLGVWCCVLDLWPMPGTYSSSVLGMWSIKIAKAFISVLFSWPNPSVAKTLMSVPCS